MITYVEPEGAEITVDVPLGLSVMEGAVRNGVSGIDAECGGACNCATCHIYIDAKWQTATGVRSDDEEAMLDLGAGVSKDSRLSCQIWVTDDLDGLIVRVAKRR